MERSTSSMRTGDPVASFAPFRPACHGGPGATIREPARSKNDGAGYIGGRRGSQLGRTRRSHALSRKRDHPIPRQPKHRFWMSFAHDDSGARGPISCGHNDCMPFVSMTTRSRTPRAALLSAFLSGVIALHAVPSMGAPAKGKRAAGTANVTESLKTVAATARRQAVLEESYVGLMKTSMALSKTITGDALSATPAEFFPNMVKESRARYETTARFVINHAKSLPLNGETAITINTMLTGESDWSAGPKWDAQFRAFDEWIRQADQSKVIDQVGPLHFAKLVHDKVVDYHPFCGGCRNGRETGGNGRTARMMADLILLRHDLPPLSHSSMYEYFIEGSPWGGTGRWNNLPYFESALARSQMTLRTSAGASSNP